MTIVPRTGPLSASSALAMTSWYQRGKSSACGVSTVLAMRVDPRVGSCGPLTPVFIVATMKACHASRLSASSPGPPACSRMRVVASRVTSS